MKCFTCQFLQVSLLLNFSCRLAPLHTVMSYSSSQITYTYTSASFHFSSLIFTANGASSHSRLNILSHELRNPYLCNFHPNSINILQDQGKRITLWIPVAGGSNRGEDCCFAPTFVGLPRNVWLLTESGLS